jgi:hypothetical protein
LRYARRCAYGKKNGARMNIPDSIKIGGHIIPIERKAHGDIGSSGQYVIHSQTIELVDTGPEDRIAETFLHEIIEGIKYFNQLELSHQAVCTLSESLFDVLRNNKLDFSAVSTERKTEV